MSNLMTPEQQKIAEFIEGKRLCAGVGSKEEACTIASINLALTGKLTDTIPECVCPVIGKWVIVTQDFISDELRNSPEWFNLVPLLAGTKDKAKEQKRLGIIMDDLWTNVLPKLQDFAIERGFGEAWQHMTDSRTEDAAAKAAYAAAKAAYTAAKAAKAARAARAASWFDKAADRAAARVAAVRAAAAAAAAANAAAWSARDKIQQSRPALLAKLIAA